MGSNDTYITHVPFQDVLSLEKALATYGVTPNISYKEAAVVRITAEDAEKISTSQAATTLITHAQDFRNMLARLLSRSWYPVADGGYGAQATAEEAKPILDALSDFGIAPAVTEDYHGVFMQLSSTQLKQIHNMGISDRMQLASDAQQTSFAKC